ncbi:MAG: molybdenum cofactor guanylyltransferase MobA [Gammaproteobacteria bacterium]
MHESERSQITAVVLAGGQGSRMGGVDKGLTRLDGQPMVSHVLHRLAPQTGRLLINANRNRTAYAALGYPVLGDRLDGYQGPLAGIACALAQIETPLLLTAPCDTPLLPDDLALRLFRGMQAGQAEIAVAFDGERVHPVCALLRRELAPSLDEYLNGGGRKIDLWYAQHATVGVDFSDRPDAFLNVNSPEEQAALEQRLQTGDPAPPKGAAR